MAVFKCKMCGASLEIAEGMTVAECAYCGTEQTLPKLNDNKANLYDRANHFRRNNDYDKAMSIYERILNEDTKDAEAYWSLVLCRYGIEYVEDPLTRKRVPTVNRTQHTSVFADEDYKSAIKYADVVQRRVYENEARAIDKIQKGILAISQKEKPFDVFICYKETGADGRRTRDSVLANDLYHQLTQEGFKVFFARITLEDKLGTAYEPYIFSALNSSKVMVVLGTKPEYFNAVWVKNEWSRYLALIRKGEKKVLIPAYRDMDPYDLPDEFSHLQAQDMSKLGFMQDLIRGIKKLTNKQTEKPVVKEVVREVRTETAAGTNTASLLRRGYMFLEDKEWNSADEYFERVLDIEPENSKAYLGKLLVTLNCSKIDNLRDCVQYFGDDKNYKKAIAFADEELRLKLIRYLEFTNQNINEQNRKIEEQNKTNIYNEAKATYDGHFNIDKLILASKKFNSISDFKDAQRMAEKCIDKIYYTLKREYETTDNMEYLQIIYGNFLKLHVYKNCVEIMRKVNEKYNYLQDKLDECRSNIAPYKNLISAGYNHTVAVKKNGKVLSVGIKDDVWGSTGFGCLLSVIVPIPFLFSFLSEFFNSYEFGVKKDLRNIIKVFAGKGYTIGITKYGNVKIVGTYCQNIKHLNYVDSIVCKNNHIIILKKDGTVIAEKSVSADYESSFDWSYVTDWKDIVDVSAGEKHTIGLNEDGTVVAKGENSFGQCNVVDWDNIVDISAGCACTIGLKKYGTVIAVGRNLYGECNVSQWKDIVAISSGDWHTVGLKADGTVVSVGNNEYGQCNVSDWKDIVAISSGAYHTVGLKKDGTVLAVGKNDSGQCNVLKWKDVLPQNEQ